MNVTRWEINSQNEFRQTFRYDGDRLHSFSLKYVVVGDTPDLTWKVGLYSKADEALLEEWTETFQSVGSGALKEYVVDPAKTDQTGGDYEIRVTSDYDGKTGMTLCGSETDSLKEGGLIINGEPLEGDLSIEYKETVNVRITLIYAAIFSMLAAALVVWSTCLGGCQVCISAIRSCAEKTWKKRKRLIIMLVSIMGIAGLAVLTEYGFSHFNILKQETELGFNSMRFVFFMSIGLLMASFVFYFEYLKRRPELVFAAAFLVIGMMYIWVIPSIVEMSWDESIHLWRAVGVSHATTGIANQAESWVYWRAGIPYGTPNSIAVLKEQFRNVQDIYNSGVTTAANTDVLSGLYMVAYIPAAIMLKLGRGLHIPFWLIFKMGSFANLLVYVSVIYFAMKKLKSGKMIVAAVAGTGTAFFLANVYSSDGWIISLSILGMAYFISCMQRDEKVTNRELCIMLGALTLAFFPKTIYFPMLLLLLFLPKSKFQDGKQYRWFISGVFASIGLLVIEVAFDSIWLIPVWAILWMICDLIGKQFEKVGAKKRNIIIGITGAVVIIFGAVAVYYVLPMIVGSGDIRGGSGVNAGEQVRGVLENPLGYIVMLLRYFKNDYLSFQHSWKNIFNTYGYMGSSIYHIYGLVLLVVVCITDKNSYDRWKRSGIVRAAAIVLGFGCVVLIASAMYVSFTPVGQPTVFGCQQRYMLPLIFPIAILLGTGQIENKMNRAWYNMGVIAAVSAVLLANIWSLAVRLYY